MPVCKDFMCTFNFESLSSARELQRTLSEAESTSHDETEISADTYSLTPNTLEYIKSDCPLVATLVSLMCSDDIEEPTLDEDEFIDNHYDASGSHSSVELGFNRSRAASSMSTLDIRSYRYEKLTQYSTLKRHLLNYIIPLAATENSDLLKGDDPILKFLTSDIIERFKTNMLSSHESRNFRRLLSELLNELFALRKWKEILQIIDSIPVNVVMRQTSLCDLHDFVVCCLVHTQCSKADDKMNLIREKSEDIMTLLHRIMSPEMQAREILSVHQKLHIDHVLESLTMCLHKGNLTTDMKVALEKRFKQIKVFHRVSIYHFFNLIKSISYHTLRY